MTSSSLHAEVVAFADEMSDLLTSAFVGTVVFAVAELGDRYIVRLRPPLELTVGGEAIADLTAQFRCHWDSTGAFLAVEKSTLKLAAKVDRAPIFRFEFERAAHSKPAGHLQVHGHRGALSHVLSRARHQAPHSMEALHLPVGGPRFRPCLEDVVQFLIEDCRFDARAGWKSRRTRASRRAALVRRRDAPYDLDSCRSNAVLRSEPPRYWPMVPSERSTRWHGTMIGMGLVASAVPAARTALGLPAAVATER